MGDYTFSDASGIPEWSSDCFHVQAVPDTGVIAAEAFELDTERWVDIDGHAVAAIRDGMVAGFNTVLVAMITAADRYLEEAR